MGAADTLMLATRIIPGVPPFHANPASACHGTKDPDLFFSDETADEKAAVRICRPCPLRDECARWAYDTRQPWGVWGGTTPRDRRPVLRARRAAERQKNTTQPVAA